MTRRAMEISCEELNGFFPGPHINEPRMRRVKEMALLRKAMSSNCLLLKWQMTLKTNEEGPLETVLCITPFEIKWRMTFLIRLEGA